ncbi:MAG: hypothetical protein ACXVHQ_42205 [Solirubrobacteraceae bacterium]
MTHSRAAFCGTGRTIRPNSPDIAGVVPLADNFPTASRLSDRGLEVTAEVKAIISSDERRCVDAAQAALVDCA